MERRAPDSPGARVRTLVFDVWSVFVGPCFGLCFEFRVLGDSTTIHV